MRNATPASHDARLRSSVGRISTIIVRTISRAAGERPAAIASQ
jgi:hypothetical protein